MGMDNTFNFCILFFFLLSYSFFLNSVDLLAFTFILLGLITVELGLGLILLILYFNFNNTIQNNDNSFNKKIGFFKKKMKNLLVNRFFFRKIKLKYSKKKKKKKK